MRDQDGLLAFDDAAVKEDWTLPMDGDDFGPAVLRLQPNSCPVPDYYLIERLGSGGSGEVWHARGPGGVDVALKFMRLEGYAGAAAERAVELVKTVRHPQLVGMSGVWRYGDMLILAMELCEGTLQDYLHERQQQGFSGIPGPELLEHLRDAARGIDALNAQGIQHRDVKPKNLLLVGGGVKVGDFGLAKFLQRIDATNTGMLSAAYAAPETFYGRTTAFSDQYSLAVSYIQLLTGRLPFVGSPAEMMNGHLNHAPDLSRIPPAQRPILERALEKNPRDRWPTCKAFVDTLAAAPATAMTVPVPAEAEYRGRKQLGIVVLLVLLGLVAMAVVWRLLLPLAA
jgi:serine/threonine protein kinase